MTQYIDLFICISIFGQMLLLVFHMVIHLVFVFKTSKIGNTFDQCPVENIFYSNGRNEKTNYSNVVVRKVGKYDYFSFRENAIRLRPQRQHQPVYHYSCLQTVFSNHPRLILF